MITVRLFAMLRELAGAERLEVPLPDGGRVRDLEAEIVRRHPSLADAFRRRKMLVAVNNRYASLDIRLADGDEVAFLPPVSGG